MDKSEKAGNPSSGDELTKLKENDKKKSTYQKKSIDENKSIHKNIAPKEKISSFLKKNKQGLITGGSLLAIISALIISIICLRKQISIHESEKIPKIEKIIVPQKEVEYPPNFLKEFDLKDTEPGHSTIHPRFKTKTKQEIIKNIYVLSTSFILVSDAVQNGDDQQDAKTKEATKDTEDKKDTKEEDISFKDVAKLATTTALGSSFYQNRAMEAYLHLMLDYYEMIMVAKDGSGSSDLKRVEFLFIKCQEDAANLKMYLEKTKKELPSKQNQKLTPFLDSLYPLFELFPSHRRMMANALRKMVQPAREYLKENGAAKPFNPKEKKILSAKPADDTLLVPLVTVLSTFDNLEKK